MKRNIKVENISKQKKKNKVKKVLLTILLPGLIFITGCNSKVPDVQTMKNSLPNEIAIIEVDGVSIPLKAETIKMEKQQINKKSSTAYCEVECNNDNYSCTKYVILNYNYYEKGGWILDSWDYYKESKCHVLKDPFTEDEIISLLEGWYGTNGISLTDSNFDSISETVTYQFDADLNYRYISKKGVITWTAAFKDDGGFFWSSEIEDSGLVIQWDITGHWSWEDSPSKRCELLIRTFDPDTMTAEGYSNFTGDYWDPYKGKWDTREYAVSSAVINKYGAESLVLSFGNTSPEQINFKTENGRGTYVVFNQNSVTAFFEHFWGGKELTSEDIK